MDGFSDPILAQHQSTPENGEYSFLSIPDSIIQTVGTCVQTIWTLGKFGKSKSPQFIIDNVRAVFRSEEVRARDLLWKEHCAGDLRELAERYETNYQRFLKTVAKRGESEETRALCESTSAILDFLNDFHHMRSGVIEKAQAIVDDTGLKSIDDRVFDKICTQFVMNIHRVLTFHPK